MIKLCSDQIPLESKHKRDAKLSCQTFIRRSLRVDIHADRARRYENPCRCSREKTRVRMGGERILLSASLQSCRKYSKGRRAMVKICVLIFLEEQWCWYLEAHLSWPKSTEDTRLDGPSYSYHIHVGVLPLWLLDLSVDRVFFFRHPGSISNIFWFIENICCYQ